MDFNQLRRERTRLLEEAKMLLDRATSANRDLDGAENKRFNDLMIRVDNIARMVGGLSTSDRTGIDGLIAELNRSQQPPIKPAPDEQYQRVQTFGRYPEDRFSFVRAIRGITTGNWAGAEFEQRLMGTGIDTSGGYLVTDTPAAELIQMLVPQLIFSRVPGVRIYYPTGGPMPFPKKTGRSTAYWVGEGQDITESAPTFGEIKMTPRKLAALISVNKELLADTSGTAEQIIRDDLTEALQLACDLGYLRGIGAANQPLGIRNWTGINTIAVAGTPYTDFLVDALVGVMANNAEPTCWIANPRTKGKLLKLKDGDGRPLLISDYTGMPRDLLLGLSALYSSQVPTNLGAGTNETEIYCLDGKQIAIGIWQEIEIEASNQAAIWDAAAGRAISAFQRDQVLVKATMRTDIIVRQPAGIAVMTGVVL